MRPDTKLHWKERTLDHDFMIIITKGNLYLYLKLAYLQINGANEWHVPF